MYRRPYAPVHTVGIHTTCLWFVHSDWHFQLPGNGVVHISVPSAFGDSTSKGGENGVNLPGAAKNRKEPGKFPRKTLTDVGTIYDTKSSKHQTTATQ